MLSPLDLPKCDSLATIAPTNMDSILGELRFQLQLIRNSNFY